MILQSFASSSRRKKPGLVRNTSQAKDARGCLPLALTSPAMIDVSSRGAHFLASLGPIAQMDAREWKRALDTLAADATPMPETFAAPTIISPTDTPEHLELFA